LLYWNFGRNKMAVQRFKLSLNNAVVPLLSTNAPRAVFVPQLDSAPRTPRYFVGTDASADFNTTQVIYAENVMPVAEGIRSVGYRTIIPANGNSDFSSVFPLRDADENVVLYSPSKGKNYIHNAATNSWTPSTIPAIIGFPLALNSFPAASKVSYAYVDGKTFVCYSRLTSLAGVDASLLFWDATTSTLAPAGVRIKNLPFAAGEIDGISSSNGYLLVWSKLSVAWAGFDGASFDFAPYANGAFTGAGVQIPEDIQGNITAVIGVAGGFIMFTARNAVGASYYAQSVASPWVFREIAGCGGLESYEQATVEGTLADVQAYTSSGMQSVSLNSSSLKHPAVSDFITGRKIERYKFGTHELYQAAVTLDFFTKVTNIGNRYVVISYGTYPGIYSYALVYDGALERWGKLRVIHSDCFHYTYGVQQAKLTYSMLGDVTYSDLAGVTYAVSSVASNALTSAQHSLAFLKKTGEVVVATWSDQARTAEDAAVMVIGRVQLSRSSQTQFNRAELEGLTSGRVYLQPSYDGRNLQDAEQLIDIERTGDYLLAGALVDCKNFNLVVEGTFKLSTVIVEGTAGGKM
jgi:hypothetical protein